MKLREDKEFLDDKIVDFENKAEQKEDGFRQEI
jgi:hypothetical protein